MENQQLLDIYFMMNKIRKFEEKALHLFEANKLRGSVHLCIGQEATPATVCSLLNEDDYITSTHRGHGHCIAKGADVRYALAELMGRATGYCKGRGGSMHIADFTKGNLGANAIVGGGIPIAVGAALASKMQNEGKVAISFFGDSASNEGTFHESLNLAAVWKLPVVFVCENNLYGISVPSWQSTSVKDIAVRGEGYNMPYVVVDGNKPDEIEQAARVAIERARAGEGPTLIECKTYRWQGHHVGDPGEYRDPEELAAWKAREPLAVLKEKGVLTDAEITQIEAEVDAEILEAITGGKKA